MKALLTIVCSAILSVGAAETVTCCFVSADGATNDLNVSGWSAELNGEPCALRRGERRFADHVFRGGWVFENLDYRRRQTAVLSASFTAPADGTVVAGLSGDWFYDIAVDGKEVFTTGGQGNGTSTFGYWNQTLACGVKKGRHRLRVRLRNGIGGMMFALGRPEPSPEPVAGPVGLDAFKAAYRRIWAGDTATREADLAILQRGIDMTGSAAFRRFVDSGRADFARAPALELINAAIDRLLAEVPKTRVSPGTVAAWYVYNMGFVVKTPGGTVFAVDLYAPRSEEIAQLCDFALVTHNHPDHAHQPFIDAMQKKGGFLLGKPVVSSFLYSRYFARTPTVFRLGDCLIETGVSDHNEHWPESMTPYKITCGTGPEAVTLLHAGDGWDGRQLAPFAPVDVAIVHVWPYEGHNGETTARVLRPGVLVLAHHQELSHGRGVARFSFERTRREAQRVGDAETVLWPVWGEKFIWRRRAPFRNAKWIGPTPSTRPAFDFGDARWISSAVTNRFVRRFTLETVPPGACELAFAARDQYDLRLNGVPLAACYWEHDHDWRHVRALDVAEWLRTGENELVFTVQPPEGERPAVIARLDCGARRIVTDARWGDVAVGGGLRDVKDGASIRSRTETVTPAFEKRFTVDGPVAQATLSITGLGFYETRINGRKVGDRVLDPSPTDYTKRVLYSVYDVGGHLKPGVNVMDILLGHGWYDQRSLCVWQFDAAPWRDFPRTIAALAIRYVDGRREEIVTDGTWRQVTREIAYDDIMEGEIIDRRRAGRFIAPAAEVPAPKGTLVQQLHPGTKVMRTIRPQSVEKIAPRRFLITFPENTTGWMRMNLRGQPAGTVVSFTYDERLDAKGRPPAASPWRERPNIWNGQVADDIRRIDAYFVASGGYRTLPGAGAALQRDRVICSGAETETYEPKFSYKGFRYVTVDGLRGEIDPADIEGCVVSTAFPKTGSFTCSDELFNRLMAAADRSYRCNFTAAVPTDCPHREKNGWMGDAAASVETAQYLYDNTAAYRKWVADISDAQRPSGELPGIVPTSGWGYFWGNGPGWDAALGVVAEAVYRHKGDPRLLIEAYPALKKLCGFYAREKLRGDLVDWGLGDWCAPKPEKMPTVAYTSSCHVMRTHEIAALAAELCGRADEGRAFTAQARKIRAALRATFMKSPGVFDNGGQTAQGMAIEYGLLDPGEWKAAGDRLVAAFDAEDGASAGGIYGMRHNFRALSRIGRTDLAFQALTRKDGRSPALFLSDGGGTLWEDWEDRSSRNHVMFCDFAGWAYAHLAGIRPIASGYRKILFAPETVSALDFVDASVETPRGTVRSAWRRRGAVVTFDVRVPEGCTAEIRLPGGLVRALGPGRHQLEEVGK